MDIFSQGAAILDSKDPDTVRARVYEAYERFERDYVGPAWAQRAGLLDAHARGEIADDDVPHDILTALLRHRADPSLELGDERRIVREVATYLQGGTHTNGQVVVNATDLLFEALPEQPGILDRLAEDRLFAQRVVHETLRLRPTTPKIRRRTVADTTIAGRPIPANALVVLDVVAGNQDPALFGAQPERFDPDRTVAPDVPRWGHSFGAGAHICPGRTVGGGFPVPDGRGRRGAPLWSGRPPAPGAHAPWRGAAPRPAARARRPDGAVHSLAALLGRCRLAPGGRRSRPVIPRFALERPRSVGEAFEAFAAAGGDAA